MGFARRLKYGLWDILLSACATTALVYVLCTGFDCTRPLQSTPALLIAVCVALSLVLFCISYTPLTAAAGSVMLLGATAAAMVLCWQASGAESLLDDATGNYAPFVLIAVLCAALVHVLGRRKTTTLVLLAGGLLFCAAIEYLYFLGHLVPTLLFAAAVATLYAYRTYQGNLLGSASDAISFGTASLAGLAIVVVSLCLGVGIFTLCIAPLNPPNIIVKLLTEHVRVDEEEVRGIGDNVSVQNDLLYSNNVSQQTPGTTGDEGDTEQEPNMEDTNQTESSESTPNAGSALGLTAEEEIEAGEATNTEVPSWLFLIVALCALAAVGMVIVARKLLRRRAWNRVAALPPQQRVEKAYLFFMQRFKRLKLPQPETLTLSEYAVSARGTLQRFEQVVDVPAFDRLTAVYCAAVYGRHEPQAREVDAFEDYHRAFYRNACAFKGKLKYLWLFFRI